MEMLRFFTRSNFGIARCPAADGAALIDTYHTQNYAGNAVLILLLCSPRWARRHNLSWLYVGEIRQLDRTGDCHDDISEDISEVGNPGPPTSDAAARIAYPATFHVSDQSNSPRTRYRACRDFRSDGAEEDGR